MRCMCAGGQLEEVLLLKDDLVNTLIFHTEFAKCHFFENDVRSAIKLEVNKPSFKSALVNELHFENALSLTVVSSCFCLLQ